MSLGPVARVMAVVALLMTLRAPSSVVAQSSPSPCDWTAEQPVTDPWDLTGRLGSTREAFEAKYGMPLDQIGPTTYEVPGCGTIFVSWSPDGYATQISLYSPRKDPNKGFENHDDADWTLGEAQGIAVNFAPLDAQYDRMGLNSGPSNYWFKVGYSDALSGQVPTSAWDYADNTPTYGTFLLTLWIVDSDIYLVDMDFGYQPEDTPST